MGCPICGTRTPQSRLCALCYQLLIALEPKRSRKRKR